jgi:hypothetical protein
MIQELGNRGLDTDTIKAMLFADPDDLWDIIWEKDILVRGEPYNIYRIRPGISPPVDPVPSFPFIVLLWR